MNNMSYYGSKQVDRLTRWRPLSHDEEIQLGQAIEAGRVASEHLSKAYPCNFLSDYYKACGLYIATINCGQQSRVKLYRHNIQFAITVAAAHQRIGVQLDDLIQEALSGLWIASGKYDWKKGFKFISFAVWNIRREIQFILLLRVIQLQYHRIHIV